MGKNNKATRFNNLESGSYKCPFSTVLYINSLDSNTTWNGKWKMWKWGWNTGPMFSITCLGESRLAHCQVRLCFFSWSFAPKKEKSSLLEGIGFHSHLWFQSAFETMPATSLESKSWTVGVSQTPIIFIDQQPSEPSNIETCHPCGHGPRAGRNLFVQFTVHR